LVLVIFKIVLSERAKKDLKKIPRHVIDKLDGWVIAKGNAQFD
jgi:hypothetical protein